MRCPDCRLQCSRFSAAPDKFRPADELVCPRCGAGLRVGWWPAAAIAVLAALTVAAVAASFWFGAGDWLFRELGLPNRRVILRALCRAAVAVAVGASLFGPGMYAIWVFGWYARRPAAAGHRQAGPGPATDPAKL